MGWGPSVLAGSVVKLWGGAHQCWLAPLSGYGVGPSNPAISTLTTSIASAQRHLWQLTKNKLSFSSYYKSLHLVPIFCQTRLCRYYLKRRPGSSFRN